MENDCFKFTFSVKSSISVYSGAYTYEDFWPLKFSGLKSSKKVFQKIPACIHIRGFLTTGKFSYLKSSKKKYFEKSPHAYTYGDFWSLENSIVWKVRKKCILKNPRKRTHKRIFDHWKIQPSEKFEKKVFQKIPTRVHIRGFLTTGKFSCLKSSKKSISKNPRTRTHARIFDYWKTQNTYFQRNNFIRYYKLLYKRKIVTHTYTIFIHCRWDNEFFTFFNRIFIKRNNFHQNIFKLRKN